MIQATAPVGPAAMYYASLAALVSVEGDSRSRDFAYMCESNASKSQKPTKRKMHTSFQIKLMTPFMCSSMIASLRSRFDIIRKQPAHTHSAHRYCFPFRKKLYVQNVSQINLELISYPHYPSVSNGFISQHDAAAAAAAAPFLRGI